MSKLLKDGLNQNFKIFKGLFACFAIMMIVSCCFASNPMHTFQTLFFPYLFFILASYAILMVLPRITFHNLLKEQLSKDGYDSSELEDIYNINKTVLFSKHYLLHIPSQSIIHLDLIEKVIIKSNHQITSLTFVKADHHARTLILKTGIVDEILNYLSDPSVQTRELVLEEYHDEHLKEELNLLHILMIFSMLMIGILVAIHFH